MARETKRANRQRIWEAAYAAAFVEAFSEAKHNELPFDVALLGKAEEAICVADAAVAQLEEWIREGNA